MYRIKIVCNGRRSAWDSESGVVPLSCPCRTVNVWTKIGTTINLQCRRCDVAISATAVAIAEPAYFKGNGTFSKVPPSMLYKRVADEWWYWSGFSSNWQPSGIGSLMLLAALEPASAADVVKIFGR